MNFKEGGLLLWPAVRRLSNKRAMRGMCFLASILALSCSSVAPVSDGIGVLAEMQERIATAKTLRVTFTERVEVVGQTQGDLVVVSALVRKPYQASVSARSFTTSSHKWVASDMIVTDSRVRHTSTLQPEQSALIVDGVVRQIVHGGGYLHANTVTSAALQYTDVRVSGQLAHVPHRVGSMGTARQLVYKARTDGGSYDMTGCLWLSDMTGLPVRRVLTLHAPNSRRVTITHEFSEFRLDEAIREEELTPYDMGLAERRHQTRVVLEEIDAAIECFKLDHGTYPTRLADLVEPPPSVNRGSWPREGYLRNKPRDAWNRDFRYAVPGSGGAPFDLYSLGGDGQEGGVDDGGDIWLRRGSFK